MLIAKDITCRIGRREVVKSCSLSVPPGTFTAIVGPNGAGKSTLLKALAHESPYHKGKMTVNGADMRKLSNKSLAGIRAVMPQHTEINFPFTVAQVVEIGCFAHDTNPVDNERIIQEVIDLARLTAFKSRVYQTLSGGEKQRVQLARMMAQIWEKTPHAKYLLLDEPTSDLDIMHQHRLLGIVRNLLKQNIGVLAILHDLNLAAHYADYLIFMKQGQIMQQGAAETVFTKEHIELTFSHPVQMLKVPKSNKSVCLSIRQ